MRSFLRSLHSTPDYVAGSNPIELLQKLHSRGLVNDNSAGFSDHLLRKRTIYAGFDPTAETLHIGSLSLLATMCMFANHGHEVIALIGGATALVGDPSGRSTGRKQLSAQQVEHNSKGIAEVIQRVVGRHSRSVRIVNNTDWISKVSLLDFLRDTGNHFRVGSLLARDSVKNRMASGDGLSYTEMSYQLMQAHDFAFLHKEFGCTVQLGGADQWGNIVGGIELVRKVHNSEVHAMTIPLVLNSSGEKLGKSAGNAVWLRQDMTSLYTFRQYLFNIDDASARRLVRRLTLRDEAEILAAEASANIHPEGRDVQRLLIEGVIDLVYGRDAVLEAESQAQMLQGRKDLVDNSHVVSLDLTAAELPIPILEVVVRTGAVTSKKEAKRLVDGGGLSWAGTGVIDPHCKVAAADFKDGLSVLRVGKKRAYIVRLKCTA